MNINKILSGKKGEMPWWMMSLILAFALLVTLLLINSPIGKAIKDTITGIFTKW